MSLIRRTRSCDIVPGNEDNDTISGAVDNDVVAHEAAAFGSDFGSGSIQFTTDLPHGEDNIDLCALLGGYDPDPITNLPDGITNQLAWGFHVPTALGSWFQQAGGNALIYVDVDGNAVTSSLWGERRQRESSPTVGPTDRLPYGLPTGVTPRRRQEDLPDAEWL